MESKRDAESAIRGTCPQDQAISPSQRIRCQPSLEAHHSGEEEEGTCSSTRMQECCTSDAQPHTVQDDCHSRSECTPKKAKEYKVAL